MTPSLLPRLATGEVSRDLDAAICVALQYVQGVPEARGVESVEDEGDVLLVFMLDNSTAEHSVVAPPLTSDLNAVMALEKAKGCSVISVDLAPSEVRVNVWPKVGVNYAFFAPTEIHARVGVLYKMVEGEG